MSGILRYGAYLPYYRLPRSRIASAWQGRGGKGEKAVANHDEDSLTLAVEAARDCLDGFERNQVDGLFFVSTTSPYSEKQGAALIASVLGLRPDILTADLSHCLRSGITALELAHAYTVTGRAQTLLVVFADTRTAHPGSPMELWLGDGAAAFLMGNGDVAARWEAFHTLSNEMMDVWRTGDGRFIQTWEDRWVKQHGLLEMTCRTATQLIQKAGLTPEQIDHAVLSAPDPRSHKQLTKKMHLKDNGQVVDPLFENVGAAGVAQAPMLLALALERADPDQSILITGYGDGADAALLKTTPSVQKGKGRRSVSGCLQNRRELPNYERYLWYRGLVDVDPPTPLLVDSSATVLLRERKAIYQLVGSRCTTCNEAAYPIQRICIRCQSMDAYDEIPLAECRGRLFTYTLDNLASQVDPPLIQSVVDLDPGCRIYTGMTDADPSEVALEMEVEMTFRRSRKASGFYNYAWKCRPLR